MQIKTIKPDDVRFNPITGSFEALVTIQTGAGISRYPCAVRGSIKTPPAGIIFKLVQQAKDRHQRRHGLCAHTAAPDRSGGYHQPLSGANQPLAA